MTCSRSIRSRSGRLLPSNQLSSGQDFLPRSTDNKGQHFAHILGVAETLKEKGELPVNVIFLLEGEEEIGSPNLAPFLATHKDELKCDVCAVSDTGMIGPGIPTMTYGLRGIACLEFKIHGPTPSICTPASTAVRCRTRRRWWRASSARFTMNSARVQIAGFYDSVVDLEAMGTGHVG
jgi:hypothetical protein